MVHLPAHVKRNQGSKWRGWASHHQCDEGLYGDVQKKGQWPESLFPWQTQKTPTRRIFPPLQDPRPWCLKIDGLYKPHSPKRSKGIRSEPLPTSPGPISRPFPSPSWALPGEKELQTAGGGCQPRPRVPAARPHAPRLEPPKEELKDIWVRGFFATHELRFGLGPGKCCFPIAKLYPQSDRLELGVPTGDIHATGWHLAGVLMAPQPPLKPVPSSQGWTQGF